MLPNLSFLPTGSSILKKLRFNHSCCVVLAFRHSDFLVKWFLNRQWSGSGDTATAWWTMWNNHPNSGNFSFTLVHLHFQDSKYLTIRASQLIICSTQAQLEAEAIPRHGTGRLAKSAGQKEVIGSLSSFYPCWDLAISSQLG
jgi:hypothetical protein